jgi:hypothetical protein
MVATEELYDFSGGIKFAQAGVDFTDRQWSELFGVLFDADRTLRSQWARQLLDGAKVESFWVWDGKIVYRTPPVVSGQSSGYDGYYYNDGIEIAWFGAGLPDDNSDGKLNKFLFSDIALRWDDPVSGFWDAGYAWV